jgi:predicted branched-subunit amino acid permease
VHKGEAVISLLADRRDMAAGARAMVPWLAGVAPFGLVIGVSAARADVPTPAGWLTGPLINAGSSPVTTIGMPDAGAAPIVVVAAALIVNIRLIFYSATMARHWRGTPRWWRFVAAYLLVDPSLAVGLDGYGRLAAAGRQARRRADRTAAPAWGLAAWRRSV